VKPRSLLLSKNPLVSPPHSDRKLSSLRKEIVSQESSAKIYQNLYFEITAKNSSQCCHSLQHPYPVIVASIGRSFSKVSKFFVIFARSD
jgi:hypothetical protein